MLVFRFENEKSPFSNKVKKRAKLEVCNEKENIGFGFLTKRVRTKAGVQQALIRERRRIGKGDGIAHEGCGSEALRLAGLVCL